MKPLLLVAALLAASSLRAETAPVATSTPEPASAPLPAPDIYANWKIIAAWAMDSVTPQPFGTAGTLSMAVTEKNGHESLQLVKGVTVDEVPGAPSGKALVFDGSQTAAVSTSGPIDLRNSVEFSFNFRPATTGTPLQTLMKANVIYEIRLVAKDTRIEFTVSLPQKKYKAIHLTYKPDEWNTLRARLRDGQMSFKVNDNERFATLPPDAPLENVSNRILLGFFGGRTYTGVLANLIIRVP